MGQPARLFEKVAPSRAGRPPAEYLDGVWGGHHFSVLLSPTGRDYLRSSREVSWLLVLIKSAIPCRRDRLEYFGRCLEVLPELRERIDRLRENPLAAAHEIEGFEASYAECKQICEEGYKRYHMDDEAAVCPADL